MMKLDLVRLIDDTHYIHTGITKGMYGIVINANKDNSDVIFFNPQNMDDYIIVKIRVSDLSIENEKLPKQIQAEIQTKLEWIKNKAKTTFLPSAFKNYDRVELINDEKYKTYGLKNGDIGYVIDCTVIKGTILVYFDSARPDDDGFTDSISIKVDDLELI